jgi:hypothetical protein
MEFTEVPPSITPTLNVVFGFDGVVMSPIIAMALPIAWMGVGVPNAP